MDYFHYNSFLKFMNIIFYLRLRTHYYILTQLSLNSLYALSVKCFLTNVCILIAECNYLALSLALCNRMSNCSQGSKRNCWSFNYNRVWLESSFKIKRRIPASIYCLLIVFCFYCFYCCFCSICLRSSGKNYILDLRC